jgi:hypothetical protein
MGMEPEVAHEEVPVEDATIMPVLESRNRRRDRRNLSVEHRQKVQQDVVAARRGTTRRAQVARRNILFAKKTRNYHASRKNLALACRGTTRREKVARDKENFVGRNRTKHNIVLRTSKGWTLGRRLRS